MRSIIGDPTRHFVRHYLEMVAAMFLGMLVLGVPADLALSEVGAGWSDLEESAPAVLLVAMTVTMTIPMVAWMRFRGHGWRPCWEMTAAMALPTAVVVLLLWAGALDGLHTGMLVEHVAMPLTMLGAMLLRRDEYTGANGSCHAVPA